MKRNLTILIVTLFMTLTAIGQRVYFIGEQGYPCSKTLTLTADSDKYYITDLNVIFAKDGKKALIAVSTETKDVFINGKLLIYLSDGAVITLDDGISDYVNSVASAGYHLSDDDLDKMKNTNILSIRYNLKDEFGRDGAFGGSFSASNKTKIDVPTLVSDFFID